MRNLNLKKRFDKLTLIALLAPLAIQGNCEPVLTQNPAEHFVDGKMPEGAFRIANQIWEIPSAEKLLARLAADQKNPYLVKVGVMDNGVDIAHPDLVDQIDFGTDGKRITSAGFDVMGGDRFGSPAILHLEYYAFGAEGIEANKIKGAAKDPIGLMKKYDQAFLKDFIPKMKAHPIFGKDIFSKIDETNFSLIGAHRIAIEDFDAEGVARSKSEGKLLSLDWRPKAGSTPETVQSYLSDYYGELYEPFTLGSDGMPASITNDSTSPGFWVNSLEHGEEFKKFVTSEFESFAKRSGYEKDFEQLIQFLETRAFDKTTARPSKVSDALERLASILVFSREGYQSADPAVKMGKELYKIAVQNQLRIMTEFPKTQIKPTKDDLISGIRELISVHEDSAKEMLLHPERFTPAELESVQQFLARKETWTNFLDTYISRKNFDPASLLKPLSVDPSTQSKYRKYLVRSKHPMIDVNGVEESHGTHVSGIIAKQNEDIRIVPMRVITRGTKDSPVKDAELLKTFDENFQKWLREPLVLRAIEDNFGTKLGGKKGEALIAELMKIYADVIPQNFLQNKTDLRFLGEVQQAIEIAGREKIKLVNVSLGTTFDRGVIDYRNMDLDKQLKASFEFLKFEYLKWEVAKVANNKAPNTLFLVATGNDGAWKDGRSKSALPVDLSSSFLAKYEDEAKGLVAPNNKVKNILGVGSLSQLDEISSYSNLLISKTPTIMARGEQVLSPIRPISNEAVSGLYNEKLTLEASAETIQSTIENSDRLDDLLKKRYKITGTAEEVKLKLDDLKNRLGGLNEFFSSAESALSTDLFLRFPNARARYSGTSMATPTLTGMLANEVNLKAKRLGIPTSEIYANPEFSPSALIKLVQSKSEAMFENTSIIKLRKWTGEKLWEKTSEETSLDKFVKENETRKSELGSLPHQNILWQECQKLLQKAGQKSFRNSRKWGEL